MCVVVVRRYDGWVTELQDSARVKDLRSPAGIDNLLYSADTYFSCFADLALTSPVEYFKEGEGSLMQCVITPAAPYFPWTNEAIAAETDKQVGTRGFAGLLCSRNGLQAEACGWLCSSGCCHRARLSLSSWLPQGNQRRVLGALHVVCAAHVAYVGTYNALQRSSQCPVFCWRVFAQVRQLFPSARNLQCTWHSIVKIGQSLYREAPGMDPFRPNQTTPVPNFFLAGSYTKQVRGGLCMLLRNCCFWDCTLCGPFHSHAHTSNVWLEQHKQWLQVLQAATSNTVSADLVATDWHSCCGTAVAVVCAHRTTSTAWRAPPCQAVSAHTQC
jgi:uncharacterized protein with NAD-binding domain and iron-sulfur cluster